MKRTLIAAAGLALVAASGFASAASWSVVVEPGVYGRVAIGGYAEAPQVYSAQPVVAVDDGYGDVVQEYVEPDAVSQAPVYLWVPEYKRTHWAQYCNDYGAYGVPVYFIDDGWYRANVLRRNWTPEQRSWSGAQWIEQDRFARERWEQQRWNGGQSGYQQRRRFDEQRDQQARWDQARHDQARWDQARNDHDGYDHDRAGRDQQNQNGAHWDQGRGRDAQPVPVSQPTPAPRPQPGNSWQQPGHAWQQPGNSWQQPGHGSQQPGNTWQQPGHASQQPGNTWQQPVQSVTVRQGDTHDRHHMGDQPQGDERGQNQRRQNSER